MEPTTRTAETVIAKACPSCDGALALRVSEQGAYTFCSTCHVLSHPKLINSNRGHQLYFPQADA